MGYKWIKHWSFYAVLGVIAICTIYANRAPARDYSGITVYEYKDIAIRLFDEQPVIWRTPHKLSMKKRTKVY